MTCKASAARMSNSFLLLSRGEILDAPARFAQARAAQKRKSHARRVPARAASGKRPVLTGRRRESEAKTESRPAIEPSGIKRKDPPRISSGGP